MKWSEKKVAYASYSKKLDAPGDRRRFVFYAGERDIKFERADPQFNYDIIYLTYGCDLGAWIDYKRRNPAVKIVFELIDSYLLQDASILTAFKGLVRFFVGRESKLFFNYKSALIEIISICDAVVCSTDLQRNNLLQFNENIHISLDYFSNDIITHKKCYRTGPKIKLVWEGQPYTVANLLLLNEVLDEIKDSVELYIITDLTAEYYLGLHKVKTVNLLKRLNCNYNLIPWSRDIISAVVSNSDLAIIPIISEDSFSYNKPENKLLFFWEMGIPVLTSDTPAYKRVMDQAGLDYYCSSTEGWLQKIERFARSNESYKQGVVDVANSYISTFHSKEVILAKWDLIFESLEN